MAGRFLVRGMLVGVVGGALAYVFAALFGASPINAAIALEGAHVDAASGPAPVSRAVQSTLGLAVAVSLYGAALGGLFALAFAVAYGRIGRVAARTTSVLVAGVGFVAVFLVPFLKYPANPPAVGHPETIGRRSALYLLMVLISVLAAVGAVLTGRSAVDRLGGWNATLVGVGMFVVLTAAAGILLPAVDEVAADFPATVLWRFRLASIGTQLVLWTTFGLLFGALTERSMRRAASPHAAPAG